MPALVSTTGIFKIIIKYIIIGKPCFGSTVYPVLYADILFLKIAVQQKTLSIQKQGR
jgi:hypothetical protein